MSSTNSKILFEEKKEQNGSLGKYHKINEAHTGTHTSANWHENENSKETFTLKSKQVKNH